MNLPIYMIANQFVELFKTRDIKIEVQLNNRVL